MNECSSIKTLNKYSNLNLISLSGQTKFRLTGINKMKVYFNSEIQDRKIKFCQDFSCFICNKWRNKYYLFYKCY